MNTTPTLVCYSLFSKFRTATQLVVLILLLSSRNFCHDEKPSGSISIRSSVGVAILPFSEWKEFFNTLGTFYQQNNPNISYALSVHYGFSRVHSVSVGGELLTSSASMTNSYGAVEWNFEGIPVTVAYERNLYAISESFDVLAGVGVSYFFSKVTALMHSTTYKDEKPLERSGRGYGVHISTALESHFNRALAMVTQVRYRFSDGMAFTQNDGDVNVEFTGFDASVGLAWTFLSEGKE